jgi:peptide/nickel transport system ATP-binding protein
LTFILVTHDTGVVAHMCDRAVVMEAGRVAQVLDREALSGSTVPD